MLVDVDDAAAVDAVQQRVGLQPPAVAVRAEAVAAVARQEDAHVHLVGAALEPAEPAADAVVLALAVDDRGALRVAQSCSNGTSIGMPARLQNVLSSPRSHSVAGVLHGLMAPSASVLRGSGMTRSRSTSMTRPKPRQVSQAPSGLLNENRLAVGSR